MKQIFFMQLRYIAWVLVHREKLVLVYLGIGYPIIMVGHTQKGCFLGGRNPTKKSWHILFYSLLLYRIEENLHFQKLFESYGEC